MTESVEERHRKEVINKILTFPANTYTRVFLEEPHPKTGKRYCNAELDVYLKELWDEAREKLDEDHAVRLGRIRAEQAAQEILFQLQRHREMEPQRCAQAAAKEARGREVFAKICRKHNLSCCEANFRLLLDPGLLDSEYTADQAVTSNAAIGLAPASTEEFAKFQQERIEQHNEALLRIAETDPSRLRTIVRQEAEQKRVESQRHEIDAHLKALRIRDQVLNYQALPAEFTKDILLQMVKNDTEKYRFLVKKFGNHNITARLQGRG